MKKHIITIAGKPGSGKSSTANRVAAELGYQRFSSGDFMRQVARDRGVTLAELGAFAERDASIDQAIDDAVRDAGSGDQLVIDSRLAFHWIPESFKVFLDLDSKTAGARIFADQNDARHSAGEHADSAEEIAQKIDERLKNERRRYKGLYGIDTRDLSPFNLVINTAEHPLEEVARMIIDGYKKWR